MKDEKIQAETASEPLTLEEEYDMQHSWRTDADKLTFITCLPLPPRNTHTSPPSCNTPHTLKPGIYDTPTHLLGDVNLFLSPSLTSSLANLCVGELELMIAPTLHRRCGYGRSTILAFMSYIALHLPEILDEYGRSQSTPVREGKMKLEGLRVKIGEGNEASLNLFRGLGFGGGEEGEKVNYFGEVELWFKGEGNGEVLEEEVMTRLRERFGVEGYAELEYAVVEDGDGSN